MADLSDVEQALVTAANGAVNPAGVAAAGVTGGTIRVYRGWPGPAVIDADLARGVVNVSVFAVPDDTRVTTRWGLQTTVSAVAATLTVSTAGMTVTFSGTAAPGQLAGMLVDAATFVQRAQTGDTPASIAASLGRAILATRPCTVSGSSVTVPGASRLVGRCVADAPVDTEWERQEQGFRVSVWTPSPSVRDLVCRTLATAFVQIPFLDLGDGSVGRLSYRKTTSLDSGQDARLYRRDLIYTVEYPTRVGTLLPSMLFGDVVLDGAMLFG